MKSKSMTYRMLVSIILMLLITYGCALTNHAMIEAARTGNINTIKSLRVEGQNINECNSDGTTALMHAILNKQTEAAKYLIESGADLKAKDKYEYDALIYAVVYRQIDIMKILISKGADVDSRDINGNIPLYTPLYHAIEEGFTEGVKVLVKNGANIKAKTNVDNHETILDFALFRAQMDVVASLGNKLWEPDPGKARIFLIGEGLYDYASVRIGNRRKDLNLASGFNFIDVDPGRHAIAVCEVHTRKSEPTMSIDTMAGHIYYFKISQNMKRRVVHYFGVKIDSFIFTPLKESEAKEAIKLMLRN
jgi:hypothetical protein